MCECDGECDMVVKFVQGNGDYLIVDFMISSTTTHPATCSSSFVLQDLVAI